MMDRDLRNAKSAFISLFNAVRLAGHFKDRKVFTDLALAFDDEMVAALGADWEFPGHSKESGGAIERERKLKEASVDIQKAQKEADERKRNNKKRKDWFGRKHDLQGE
jgi:hypothetical protein